MFSLSKSIKIISLNDLLFDKVSYFKIDKYPHKGKIQNCLSLLHEKKENKRHIIYEDVNVEKYFTQKLLICLQS